MLRTLDMADLVGLAGLATAVVAGWLITPPLAFLVLGLVLMVLAWVNA